MRSVSRRVGIASGCEASLCNLCVLCVAVVCVRCIFFHHRDTEYAEVAQRRDLGDPTCAPTHYREVVLTSHHMIECSSTQRGYASTRYREVVLTSYHCVAYSLRPHSKTTVAARSL